MSVRWHNDGCGRNTHLITDVTQRDAKEFELVALNCVKTARKGQTQETDDLWPDDLASVACQIMLVRVFESPAGPPFTVRERFISRHSPLPILYCWAVIIIGLISPRTLFFQSTLIWSPLQLPHGEFHGTIKYVDLYSASSWSTTSNALPFPVSRRWSPQADPTARHRRTLRDHVIRVGAPRDMPVYFSAFAGTKLYCLVTDDPRAIGHILKVLWRYSFCSYNRFLSESLFIIYPKYNNNIMLLSFKKLNKRCYGTSLQSYTGDRKQYLWSGQVTMQICDSINNYY